MQKLNYLALSIIPLLFQCSPGSSNEQKAESTEVAEEQIPVATLQPDTVHHALTSLEDALILLNELNYTPDTWREGVREVPRLNLMKVPPRWRSETSKEIEVKLKKQLFFRVVAPLALEANERIMLDRDRLINLIRNPKGEWKSSDRQYIVDLATKYKLSPPAPQNIRDEFLEELLSHVDIIPVSLALAQSASESGWGTSRFAAEGNALFGQWSWSEDAMKPEQQRGELGNYGLARFDSPLGSMIAYMHNLNTHNAYSDLRKRRSEIRKSGANPSGYELASTLSKYSERGQDYVDDLQSIMRVNHLEQTDSAYLSDGPVILLIPRQ